MEEKKRCRLNEADIRMAKELGMTPKSLIKNIPSANQQWKAPVKIWVRDLYEGKFGKVLGTDDSSGKRKTGASRILDDDDLPF
ncbi:hypothetical protein FZC78_10370 [Rossellomorea vietnamensis]|uniref:Uncharacterized protein n=1 Tax=Rossellomorea vietnamensis TaxID=218284 RepID=A0A5D4NRN9_9BACI|nr:hypothetical protein FZC78_10370 [Rossellomorea vietnamensis]